MCASFINYSPTKKSGGARGWLSQVTAAHGVAAGGFILMSRFLFAAGSTGVLGVHKVAMGPAVPTFILAMICGAVSVGILLCCI